MIRRAAFLLVPCVIGACSGSDARPGAAGAAGGAASGGSGSASSPASSAASATAGGPAPVNTALSLPVSTVIKTQLLDPVFSSAVKPGDTVTVEVVGNVNDGAGEVVIPSGSRMTLRLDAFTVGRGGATHVALTPLSVALHGADLALRGTVDTPPPQPRGAGVAFLDRATTVMITLTERASFSHK